MRIYRNRPANNVQINRIDLDILILLLDTLLAQLKSAIFIFRKASSLINSYGKKVLYWILQDCKQKDIDASIYFHIWSNIHVKSNYHWKIHCEKILLIRTLIRKPPCCHLLPWFPSFDQISSQFPSTTCSSIRRLPIPSAPTSPSIFEYIWYQKEKTHFDATLNQWLIRLA